MVKLTNRLGLPTAIVEAVQNDPYDGNDGIADITVTTLIAPARARAQVAIHDNELEADIADFIHRLRGQAMHAVLERAEKSETVLIEKRFYAEIEGWVLSGKADRFDTKSGVLQDYKDTSVYAAIDLRKGGKKDWIAQLNVLAWLTRMNGHEVKKLQIVALLKDWGLAALMRNRDYPPYDVSVIDVPVWDEERVVTFIKERLHAHQSVQFIIDGQGGELPECTPEECWEQPTKWAVMKKGRKSALRLLDSEQEAREWMKDRGLTDGKTHFIEKRQSDRNRCRMIKRPGGGFKSYCLAAPVCSQYAAWKSLQEAGDE